MSYPGLSDLPPGPPGKTGWPWTEESHRAPERMPDGSAWPLVSIVTPSFNQASFIEEAIRSVLLQGYPNLEYLVIDGGSTDGSVEIIRKYEPWLAYWVSEPDEGQGDAINKGWRRSSGEIVAWLNSDDMYAQGALAGAVEAIASRPGAGLVYGRCEHVDAGGTSTGLVVGEEFDLAQMLRLARNYIPQPSAFVRGAALDRVGMVDTTLHMAMDIDLWLRLALEYPVFFVSRVWSYNRCHEAAKTATSLARDGPERLRIAEKLFARADLPPDLLAIRAEATARLHVAAARGLIQLGRRREAVRSVIRGLQLSPQVAFLGTMGLAAEILLGHRLAGWLRRRLRDRLSGDSS
jgi:GT2 family glycosyltransferase